MTAWGLPDLGLRCDDGVGLSLVQYECEECRGPGGVQREEGGPGGRHRHSSWHPYHMLSQASGGRDVYPPARQSGEDMYDVGWGLMHVEAYENGPLFLLGLL